MAKPWYPFYWSNYSSKTFTLTQGQHGAYILLLRHLYATDEPLLHEDRYSTAKALLEHEQANVDAVLKKFFTRKGAEWVQKRVDEIKGEADEISKNKSLAGKKGADVRYGRAIAEPKQSHSILQPQPQLQVLAKANTPRSRAPTKYTDEFEAFWKTYPPNKGSKFEASKSFQKSLNEADHDAITRGADAYAKYCADNATPIDKTAHGTTWLNQRRWEVDYTTTSGNAAARPGGNPGATRSRSIHQPSKADADFRRSVLADAVSKREARRDAEVAAGIHASEQLRGPAAENGGADGAGNT